MSGISNTDRQAPEPLDYNEYILLAKASLSNEDLEAAAAALSHAVEENDEEPDAYYGRWVLALKEENFDGAVFALDKAESIVQENDGDFVDYAEYYEMAADEYKYAHKMHDAIDCLEICASEFPTAPDHIRKIPEFKDEGLTRVYMAGVLLKLANLKLFVGDGEGAQKLLGRMFTLQNHRKVEDPSVQFFRANLLYFHKKSTKSIQGALEGANDVFKGFDPSEERVEFFIASAFFALKKIEATSIDTVKERAAQDGLELAQRAVEVAEDMGDVEVKDRAEAYRNVYKRQAEEMIGKELKQKIKAKKKLTVPKSKPEKNPPRNEFPDPSPPL